MNSISLKNVTLFLNEHTYMYHIQKITSFRTFLLCNPLSTLLGLQLLQSTHMHMSTTDIP